MIITCKNCGSNEFYIKKDGIHTGLYCKNCNSWIKWANKDELREFTENTNIGTNWIVTFQTSNLTPVETRIFSFEHEEPTKEEIESIIDKTGIIHFMQKLHKNSYEW